MSLKEIDYELEVGDRTKMRVTLIEKLLEEEPGTSEESSSYRYNVERFGQYIIYLKRPATLNFGLDFTVNVEGLWFKKRRRYTAPSHIDVINILKECKENYPIDYYNISRIIQDIYDCNRIELSGEMGIYFKDYLGKEHPIEVVLLVIKWLFMEQDCTYWNYSGRTKLYMAFKDNGLV